MEFIFGNHENFIILVSLVILPFALMHGHKQTKKRHAKLHEIGFEIVKKNSFYEWTNLSDFNILTKNGIFRRNSEFALGVYKDYKVGLFLHSVGDGSKTGKHQTAMVLNLKEPLPEFTLRPEWLRDKLKSSFGQIDINFKSHKEFSANYFLQGSSEDKIREVFSNNVLDRFNDTEGYWVQCDGSKILIFEEYNRLRDGSRTKEFLDRTMDIVQLLESNNTV